MKPSVLVVVAMSLMFIATNCARGAINTKETRETLAGVNAFYLVMEEMPPLGTKAGLTTERMKTAIETALRKSRIPLISRDAAAKSEEMHFLSINIAFMDVEKTGLLIYVVNLEFYEPVKLESGKSARVATWGCTTFGYAGKLATDSLKAIFLEEIDTFINAYLEANPAK